MITYILIFLAKVLENTLSTLRIILVSNGKKIIGAILQGVVTLIWLWSAATVITNINDDLFKIMFFILGSLFGSYLGSLLEEKIAYGDNLLTIILDKDMKDYICNIFKDYKFNIIGVYDNKVIINLYIQRKKRLKVVNLIKLIDNNSIIYSTKVLID